MAKDWKFPNASYGRILFVDPDGVIYGVNQTSNAIHVYNSTLVSAVDGKTTALKMIEYEHHEIHGGSSFTTSYKADISNGANLDLLVVTSDTTKWAHLTYEMDVELETDILIYEGVTATAGDAVVAYNRDRNSLTAATVVVTSTPTSITPGTTLIRSYHLGSGRSLGGGARATHEFILKQNTKYLIRLTNSTTNNNYMSVKLDWYEHTNI